MNRQIYFSWKPGERLLSDSWTSGANFGNSAKNGHLVTEVEPTFAAVSSNEDSQFGTLRRYFTEIVFDVLGQNAVIAIKMNATGGIDFTAEFIGETGTATSGDKGTSYKKLLCIAFDLAMLRTYLDVPFARFVFHDGALEQLEPRKRANLVAVLRSMHPTACNPLSLFLIRTFHRRLIRARPLSGVRT